MLIKVGCTFVLCLLVLSGCSGGGADKWTEVANEPSGKQISARYVTRTKSVKIYQRKDPERKIKMSFLLSDKLPRVSGTRLGIHLKTLDFGMLLSPDRDGWINVLGVNSDVAKALANECSVVQHEIPVQVESIPTATAKFKQSKDGVITIQIGHPKAEVSLVFIRLDPPKLPTRCLTAFAPDLMLAAFAQSVLQFRDNLITLLSKEAGFNGAQTGQRLSRNSEVQFDETTNLNVEQTHS